MKRLKPEDMALLRAVLVKRAPQFLPLVDSTVSQGLSVDDREALREVVLDEFLETGMDEDQEPNSRGHMLEKLIDRIFHVGDAG